MRERFRHAHRDGVDLVIHEIPGPGGSVWSLVEDGPSGARGAFTFLWEGDGASAAAGECARRLTERHGGHAAVWEALVREALEPSY